ncbi:hypothetical protein [Dactylosporangium darangshiense]|uniref:Uncharacterized protein n=1 Tax=Dactylosporangium darangshiense TaxID=579108 RepID=A0ABP8DVA7_9ACTN
MQAAQMLADVGGVAHGVHHAIGMAGGDGFDHLARERELAGVAGTPQSGQYRQAYRPGQER